MSQSDNLDLSPSDLREMIDDEDRMIQCECDYEGLSTDDDSYGTIDYPELR